MNMRLQILEIKGQWEDFDLFNFPSETLFKRQMLKCCENGESQAAVGLH